MAREAWQRRATLDLRHLSDEAWKDITIERAYLRAKAAESRADAERAECLVYRDEMRQRAEAAERRVAELEAERARVVERWAPALASMSAGPDGSEPTPYAPSTTDKPAEADPYAMFAWYSAHQLTGLHCDSLRPTCQQPGCDQYRYTPELGPEPIHDAQSEREAMAARGEPGLTYVATDRGADEPAVHGIELAVGQRWVFRGGGLEESPPESDDIITATRAAGRWPVVTKPASGGRHTDWTVDDFRAHHARLRDPSELNDRKPNGYDPATPRGER